MAPINGSSFSAEDQTGMEEEFISYIIQMVLKDRAAELKLLERDTTQLEKVAPPFPRISYDEAVERLAKIPTRSRRSLTRSLGGMISDRRTKPS